MVIMHEIENIEKWLACKDFQHITISHFAKNMVEYVIDNYTKLVTLTLMITDEKLMNTLVQDYNTCSEMIRHGVKPKKIKSI